MAVIYGILAGMNIRIIAVAAALLCLSACNKPNTPTAPGTTILKTTFTTAQGGPPAELASVAPTRHLSHLKVAEGAAEIDVRLDIVDAPKGKYLQGLEIVVTASGGGTMTATLPPGLITTNRGTAELPIASTIVMVEWRQSRATSSSLRQNSIEILGDGTATLN